MQPIATQESPWLLGDYEFNLQTILDRDTVYWFLLHIKAPPHDAVTANDETKTKVCIHCLSCYDVQLHVEILSPQKDRSVVYTVSNHSRLEDESYFPKRQMCSVGLQCNECNIILIYKASLQSAECKCYYPAQLTMLVSQTVNRKKQAPSVTSIKHIPVSKLSNRYEKFYLTNISIP